MKPWYAQERRREMEDGRSVWLRWAFWISIAGVIGFVVLGLCSCAETQPHVSANPQFRVDAPGIITGSPRTMGLRDADAEANDRDAEGNLNHEWTRINTNSELPTKDTKQN